MPGAGDSLAMQALYLYGSGGHASVLADLVRAVSYWPPGTPPVRLLLLARHTASWWDTDGRSTLPAG